MDNQNQYKLWSLLIRNLKRESNEIEKKQLDFWLKDSSFRDLYNSLRKLWVLLLGYRVNTQSGADIDRLWGRMEGRISKRKVYLWGTPWKYLGWAVSVLLVICGISYFVHTYQGKENQKVTPIYTALTGKSKIVLPDSSVVWLNKGSTLAYLIDNEDKERRVKLKGEAFFDVYKNPQKSFVVETQDIEVRVFGTTFSVRSMADEEDIKVSLLKGSVAVATNSQIEKIVPGERAVYSPKRNCIIKEKVDVAFESIWAKDTLNIEKIPLKEVVRYLEKWYDVKILLGGSVSKDQAFTFALTDEPLEEVLRLISRISPIQYQFNDDDIVVINESSKHEN